MAQDEGVEVIRISIGTEPSQYVASQVLRSSILRRTNRPVVFTESWTPEGGWHPLFNAAPAVRKGTKFSTWRWLVPAVYQHAGRAIYLDADQVVLGDIGELWDLLPAGKSIAMVRNAVGIFGKKTPEPNHWQTSVMVMDCGRCEWDTDALFNGVNEGLQQYRDLMQATWMASDDLHEIDPAWNHFGICTPETKLLHYSHVSSQPWKNPAHQTVDVWWREFREALNSKHVTMGDVEHAAHEGHLHKKFLKRLEKTSV